ncbi:MotA/TolQ/ExbB proton channel family protein [bacterium]|nr:MotA/TolQ/ExbB proton channel family protein [bacterium]
MDGIWQLILRGGVVMIPLLLTSIIGLAVVIERAFSLRRHRILDDRMIQFIENIKQPKDVEGVYNILGNSGGPFLNIIRIGLENQGSSREEIREAMQDQGRQEARLLERGLVILETVAGIAPLLGLLGTVLGMIKVFQVISEQGLGQTQSLSGGISEALLTTVVGLSIAIPALVAYNYFNHKVDDLVMEIEKYSGQLLKKLDLFQKQRK